MFKVHKCLSVAICLATVLVASNVLVPALVGTIVQRAGESYVAWEAEEFDSAATYRLYFGMATPSTACVSSHEGEI